jgi:hypothetical protein
MGEQNGWRWCYKCQGLFFAGNPSQGGCPAGGSHDASQSGRYVLLWGDGVPGAQDGWRWCQKCQGLFFSQNPSQGICPADRGAHDGSASGHYVLEWGDAVPRTQGLWRWCQKCQGLFFSGNPTAGACPAGGPHDTSNSGEYGVPWQRGAGMAEQWVYVGGPSGANGQGGAAQVLAVHAALLPAGASGQIVYFSGSQWVPPTVWEAIENGPNPQSDPKYPLGKSEIDHTRIYDCATQQISNPGSPDTDLFCSGHAFLPDGRLLIAGGTQHFPVETERDLHHAHWSGSRQSWIFLPRHEVRAAVGSPATALWAPRQPDHLDLLMTGPDGSVWSTWWEAATAWQPWFTIHSEIKAAVGSPVTALWAPHQPDHLDLFMTGSDGTVWSTWWEAAHAWQPWFAIHPEVKAQPRIAVTALWRGQHLDLFMTGTDGAVWSTWWEAAPSWQPWFPIMAGSRWAQGPLLNRDPGQTENNGQPMGGGRWYPSLITLASGGVIAMCGHPLISEFTGSLTDFDVRHNNTKPEIFDPNTETWTLINKALGADQAHDYAPYYPRLHVVPHSGEVFIVQPLYSKMVKQYNQGDPQCTAPAPGQDLCSQYSQDTNPPYAVDVMDKSLFYEITKQQVTHAFTGPQNVEPLYVDRFYTSQETTSVLLPLLHEENYHPRVLICGAVQALIADLAPANPALLQWTATAARQLIDPATHQPPVRNFANSTLLPTGEVVVSGGVSKTPYTEGDGVKAVEIYLAPRSGQPDSWELGPVAHETRGYHSVALLIPDGRVWTAGSEWNYSATPNLSMELFEPDYYQVANRVSITASPGAVNYNQSFGVRFSPDRTIARVVLMRLGSATHAFDGDQRYVSVPFRQAGTTLTAVGPPDATIAPPGYYMLWLIDGNNLPCTLAPFVRVAAEDLRRR